MVVVVMMVNSYHHHHHEHVARGTTILFPLTRWFILWIVVY